MITVQMSIKDLLRDTEVRKELIDELLCDVDFLESLTALFVEGYTTQGSCPIDRTLADLRKGLLEGFEATTQAELVAREQNSRELAENSRSEKWAAMRKLEELSRIAKSANFQFKKAEPIEADGHFLTEGSFTLTHTQSDRLGDCEACKLTKFLNGGALDD
jgi:hypothetical protein